MKRLLIFLAVLFMLVGNIEAATYCLRNDGTAGSKTAATDCLTVGNCMNETVHNGQTFAGSDVILVCPHGGVFDSQVTTPSNGGSGTEIRYSGQYSSTYGWPVFDEGFKIATNYIMAYGFDVRPGIAESGTKTFEGGRFADGTRSWQAAEETAVTGWSKQDVGIFAVGIGATGGAVNGLTPQLYWRNKTDTGSFAAVGGSGEVKYTAATVLTDNDNVIENETGVSSGKAYTTCNQCEQEDSHQASTTTDLAADNWAELQIGISFADSHPGDEYEFSLYETGVQIGSASAATVKTLQQIVFDDKESVDIPGWQNNVSLTYTVANQSNRMLVAAFFCKNAGITLSSCTWDYGDTNQAMTPLTQYGTTGSAHLRMFYLAAPVVGTKTLRCQSSASASLYLAVLGLYNVEQGAPEASDGTFSNSASSISDTLTTLTDGAWVVTAVIHTDEENLITTQGETERVERQCSGGDSTGAMATEEIASAGLNTFGWDDTSGDADWAIGMAAFAPAE